MMIRRASRGTTLLEVMVVIAIVGVIAALAAPNLVPMVKNNRIYAQGETVAAFVDATRRRAFGDSRCYRILVVSGSLVAQRRTVGDCANLDDTNWLDVQTLTRDAPSMTFTLTSLTQPAAIPATGDLIFRPNGRLVGDGDLDSSVTDDGARIAITDTETPIRGRVVLVTANGRICHIAQTMPIPALASPVTCP